MTDDAGIALPVRADRPASAGAGRATPAVLLERWRERPEVARMRALAGEEMPGIEESGAALELIAAIETLAMEPTCAGTRSSWPKANSPTTNARNSRS